MLSRGVQCSGFSLKSSNCMKMFDVGIARLARWRLAQLVKGLPWSCKLGSGSAGSALPGHKE